VELANLNPDVIVAGTEVAMNAVQQQTRTIPIVFFGVGGIPETGGGIVGNIAWPMFMTAPTPSSLGGQ
jgi:ABC-type uncharacterized transport system substrate-binding protein